MAYGISLEIASYFIQGTLAFFVAIWGFWLLKRWIYDN